MTFICKCFLVSHLGIWRHKAADFLGVWERTVWGALPGVGGSLSPYVSISFSLRLLSHWSSVVPEVFELRLFLVSSIGFSVEGSRETRVYGFLYRVWSV